MSKFVSENPHQSFEVNSWIPLSVWVFFLGKSHRYRIACFVFSFFFFWVLPSFYIYVVCFAPKVCISLWLIPSFTFVAIESHICLFISFIYFLLNSILMSPFLFRCSIEFFFFQGLILHIHAYCNLFPFFDYFVY